jgi:hypothetical protein
MNFIGIIHIYNEEYLLPFWLNHHKNIFDKIIIINYHSTDNSINICKEIIPNCEIITTRNNCFEAQLVDNEVMDIENKYEGFKICLNITEFLVTYGKNIKEILNQYLNEKIMLKIPAYIPISLNKYYPKNNEELFKNLCNEDVKFANDLTTKINIERGCRYLHNHINGNYTVGRHGTLNNEKYFNEFIILTLYFYPNNEYFMKRKMQIKSKIPQSDINIQRGIHHFWTEEYINDNMKNYYNDNNQNNKSYPLKILDLELYNYILNESINMQ